MFKRCPDCEQTKPYSDYYVSRTTKIGIQVYCKDCSNAKNRANHERRKANGPSIKRDSKECLNCNSIKPISQFGKKTVASDGHMPYCKPCWVSITKKAQARQLKK